MWFELASHAADAAIRDLVGASLDTIRENAANRRGDLAARLTAAQIAEAKWLAGEWKAK